MPTHRGEPQRRPETFRYLRRYADAGRLIDTCFRQCRAGSGPARVHSRITTDQLTGTVRATQRPPSSGRLDDDAAEHGLNRGDRGAGPEDTGIMCNNAIVNCPPQSVRMTFLVRRPGEPWQSQGNHCVSTADPVAAAPVNVDALARQFFEAMPCPHQSQHSSPPPAPWSTC